MSNDETSREIIVARQRLVCANGHGMSFALNPLQASHRRSVRISNFSGALRQ
jgi:hypothetical protein